MSWSGGRVQNARTVAKRSGNGTVDDPLLGAMLPSPFGSGGNRRLNRAPFGTCTGTRVAGPATVAPTPAGE